MSPSSILCHNRSMQKVLSEDDNKIILLSSNFKMEDLELPEDRKNEPELTEVEVGLNYDNVSNQELLDSFQTLQ